MEKGEVVQSLMQKGYLVSPDVFDSSFEIEKIILGRLRTLFPI